MILWRMEQETATKQESCCFVVVLSIVCPYPISHNITRASKINKKNQQQYFLTQFLIQSGQKIISIKKFYCLFHLN